MQMGRGDPNFHSRYRPRALWRRAQSQQRDCAGMKKVISGQRTWAMRISDAPCQSPRLGANNSYSLRGEAPCHCSFGECVLRYSRKEITHVSSAGSKQLRKFENGTR